MKFNAVVIMAATVSAGPAAYAACQAACAATFLIGPLGPAAYAGCQAACASTLVIPGP